MSYFKPNTAAAIKLAIAVKGLSASLAGMAYMNGKPNLTFAILTIGAVAVEVINFLSDGTKSDKTGSEFPEH